MNLLRNILLGTSLGLLSMLNSCENVASERISGTVTKEEYKQPSMITKDTAVIGNPTMQLGESTYSFELETKKGIYFVSVNNCYSRSGALGGLITKESADLAISKGTKVELNELYDNYEPGKIVAIDAQDIKILSR